MKAHKMDMIAAWAKENGIRGYENYDPRERNKIQRERPRKNYSHKEKDFLDGDEDLTKV